MCNDNADAESVFGGESRRSFLQKSAVASVAVGTGVLGSGVGSAQDVDLDDEWEALVFADNFHPEARFTFVSGVVEWTPNYGDVSDSWFADYDTYQIRWLNTDEVVPLFVAQGATIGEYDADLGFVADPDDDPDQPQLYEMNREWSPFGDNPRLVEVTASPVGEDEEDRILQDQDWWRTDDDDATTGDDGNATVGNGNATVGNGTADGNATAAGDAMGGGS